MKIVKFGGLIFIVLIFSATSILSQEFPASDSSAARSTTTYATVNLNVEEANNLSWCSADARQVRVPGISGNPAAGTADDFIWISALTGNPEVRKGAAPSTIRISGRVLTAEGNPIRNAVVMLWIGNPPFVTLQAFSGSLGTYVFDGLPVGQLYTLHASAKRYRFDVLFPQISPTEDFDGLDFNAMPQAF